ncbi:MAG: Peptide/nickel transport system ATP-binding protein [Bacillota bacterium]|nr:MAG: Peptide/nickel transport system ATP-binding protein [Bacillota bacterium]MBS3951128.1 ABC transporter ATP-binding protein [Peptococcaceae bacterium]
MSPLVEVNNLKTCFKTGEGVVRAVDGVSFSIEPRRVLGVVGESGCGKSVTALSIMGLVQGPAGAVTSGEILYHGADKIIDLVKLDPKGEVYRSIRGKEIAMIFQEPMTSLNPVYTIGFQIMEAVMLHQRVNRKEARQKTIEMLRAVEIPSPEERFDQYPHHLSGGMRQRVMIAMALVCRPALLIADEPTTALDVTIQAQVLQLMRNLRQKFEMSMMLITHDLGVIAAMADDVMVMYLGQIVEKASVDDVFYQTKHPYTQGLMSSIPSLATKRHRLIPIEGTVPDPLALPSGCRFQPRCRLAMERCHHKNPALKEVAPGHQAACFLY